MAENYARTTITLPYDVMDGLKRAVPKGNYSEYIARAVSERLAREENRKFLGMFGILKAKKGDPLYRPAKYLTKLDALEKEEMRDLFRRRRR